ARYGQCCTVVRLYDRYRGTTVLGTGGSLIIDRDGFLIRDLKDKVVRQSLASQATDGVNILGDDPLTALHMRNFLDAVRTGAKLNAPIDDGAKTGLLCHIRTTAQQTRRTLRLEPNTGHISGQDHAASRRARTYQP